MNKKNCLLFAGTSCALAVKLFRLVRGKGVGVLARKMRYKALERPVSLLVPFHVWSGVLVFVGHQWR